MTGAGQWLDLGTEVECLGNKVTWQVKGRADGDAVWDWSRSKRKKRGGEGKVGSC